MRAAAFACAVLAAGAPCAASAASESVPASADAAASAAALADADYLLRLGLMRGHLLVGHALFESGAADAARTHSKHPGDELYAGMDAEFAARGTAGFAAELAAHAGASAGDDAAAVQRTYAAVRAAILRCEAAVQASDALIGQVIVLLLREAAEEYAIGVVDGQVENAHEYQDAYGFTQIALDLARQRAEGNAAFARIAERIEALATLWPALAPPPTLEGRAARLHGAAAEAEILALAL